MIVSTEAVVLHSRKFGDSSRIVTVYSGEYGKLSLMAKGAYRSKSKFGSSLEPLSISSFTFYLKHNSDLHLLSSSELAVNLHEINGSYEKMIYAMLICESIDQTQEKESPHPGLYELIKNAIIAVNNKNKPFSAFVHTQLQLAEALGFAFNFNFNFDLQEDGDTYYFYSFTGRISDYKPLERYFALTPQIMKYLKLISSVGIERAAEIDADFPHIKLFNFFSEYFTFHLEKKFRYNSLSLLEAGAK